MKPIPVLLATFLLAATTSCSEPTEEERSQALIRQAARERAEVENKAVADCMMGKGLKKVGYLSLRRKDNDYVTRASYDDERGVTVYIWEKALEEVARAGSDVTVRRGYGVGQTVGGGYSAGFGTFVEDSGPRYVTILRLEGEDFEADPRPPILAQCITEHTSRRFSKAATP